MSLLGGNWPSALVDGAHFFAALGFVQRSPMKLPLKCIAHAGHPERPAALEAPGQGFGSRSRAQLPPCRPPQSRPCRDPTGGSAHMASPCGPGAVGARGQSQRWGRVAHPTLRELRAPTAWAPGRCGSERRRSSDYLTLSEMCPQTDAQEAGASAPGQGAERAAGSAVRAFMCMDTGTRPRKTGMVSSLWNLDSGYMSVRQICLSTFLWKFS